MREWVLKTRWISTLEFCAEMGSSRQKTGAKEAAFWGDSGTFARQLKAQIKHSAESDL